MVDGGINADTAVRAIGSGDRLLVAGSAIYARAWI
jgi:pentose-5-phosphate-3-epimerase